MSTKQAVTNAAAALKKAADPWSKESRVTADRIASAAISVIDATTLSQGVLDVLSTLLRRPFAELYSTHPGTSLRLSAAILATIIYDRIVPSWKSKDSQSKDGWEQVATVLLAGVQDHVECHSDDRVKTMVAQAFYSILCNAFFSVSTPVPLTKYSVPLRVSVYSLLSTTADSCLENKDKLRNNKILGGTRLGRVITMTKDYLALEQLLILLAYLLPQTSHTVGRVIDRPERLRFLHDCFDDTERGKDLIDLLKYVASPDWEITSDKIVDILARDISVAQPFVMNSFILRGASGIRPSPVHRFYLDKTSILFNFEDEDGKIEGMHVPYSSVEHVDLSSSGTVAVRLARPPLCHDSLQMLSNGAVILMTVVLSPPDVERFSRTLRVRGMTSRMKLDGVLIRKAAERISVNRSPTRLEFDLSAKGSASYQSKVKVIEEGVFQASDPGDDIVPYPEHGAGELQHEFPLPVKECPPSAPRYGPATITTGEKISDDEGCSHVSPAPHHRLPDVHENPQHCSTTASLALGPLSPPSRLDGPSLHSPSTSGVTHQSFDVDNPALAHSPPSEHSQHSCPSNKELSDAIFGASDEELSSLSDADSVLDTVRTSAELVQPRRVSRRTGSSKRCTRSQRPRNTLLLTGPTTGPTPAVSSLGPTQDAATEQKLAPVVKGLRVMDSQDTVREKLLDTDGRNPAALAKRKKKIIIESGDELQDTSISRESPPPTTNECPKIGTSRTKRRDAVPPAQAGRTAAERPKRTCVLSTAKMKVGPKPLPSATPDRPDLDRVNIVKDPAEGDDESADDESQKGKVASKERFTARTVELKRPNTEKDIPSVSDNARPRKRARVDRENVASTRTKPARNKRGTSVIKPESSRVRKTYCRRQKTERSSPGHPANREVDFDEVPPSTVQSSTLTANRRGLPATDTVATVPIPRALRMQGKKGKVILPEPLVGTKPMVEVPNDKERANNGKPKECGPRAQIQCPSSVLEDDDPIQSFSSSPHSPSLMPVDTVKSPLETPTTCDADVLSGSVPGVESHSELVDAPPSADAQTCSPMREVTERELDEDMQKNEEFSGTTLQHLTALPEQQQPQPNTAARPVSTGSASLSPLPQGTVRPSAPGSPGTTPCDINLFTADRNDNNARESSNPLTDLGPIDGPTFTVGAIAVEQPSVQQQKENADATFSPIPETIDLTSDTPSPTHSPRSGSLGTLPFSHHISTSSPVVSKGGTSENTGSSVLDLTDTKYRDFDVNLDSSYCLPSTRTSILKRSPTPPPPRTKHKNVTFALSPEVDEEQLEIFEAPVEAIGPATWNETDELEYLVSEFEPPRSNGSSSSVDSSPCLGPRLTTKPQSTLPSLSFYPRVGNAAGPSSLNSSPMALRRNRSRLSEETSTAADPKHRHSARDSSLSPSMVEPAARGNHLASVMAILDEIHGIIKSNVQSRFESVTSDAAKLRRQILAQTRADMSALLDEYITAFNSLVNLEAKYGAFSKKRIAALTQARNANVQGLASLRAQIQAHDRMTQAHLQHAFIVKPLPGAVRRWL